MTARAAVLLALLARSALAFQPDAQSRRDEKRFRFGAPTGAPSASAGKAYEAAADFNKRHGKAGALGVAAAASAPRRADPLAAGAAFLAEKKADLGLDPASLLLERQSSGEGHKHLLYRQVFKGLAVEFARVKVHLGEDGSVIGFDSSYQALDGLDIKPTIGAAQAADVARRDAGLVGLSLASRAELVVFPADGASPARLAWKLSARTSDGLWRYYVDARTGDLIFRYNDRQQFASCLTSGTVSGEVFDFDPSSGPARIRPMNNVAVYVGDGTSWVVTQGDPGGGSQFLGNAGAYCSGANGKIFTQMQGPYVNVSNFRGASAHYDNGQGVWQTLATPLSSPHPYPGNTVIVSTIDLQAAAPSAVKFLPVFSSFHVGEMSRGAFGEADDILQDDEVQIVNSTGQIVGSFVGNFGADPYTLPINGAAVTGKLMRVRLKSTPGPGGTGYDISLSSYLVLSNPNVNANNNNVVWYPTMTASGLRTEIDLMYHLNRMHDFFLADVDKSSAAYLNAVNAVALAGPSLANAFYDPDFDDLFFGDVSGTAPQDLFGDDATVPRHEYTHFMVQKIFPIQNFGQAGAISEGVADYFSGTSLNNSTIGAYVVAGFGGSGPLRELSCPDKTPCSVLSGGNWHGEIHSDSPFLSQALWDVRRNRVAAQPTVVRTDNVTGMQVTAGQSCVDGLVFQSLLFFPESFQEFLNAMLTVDAAGSVAACGNGVCGGDPHSCVQATINAAFAAHGLSPVGGTNDPYDTVTRHNDGFQTAVDISTLSSVTGTIFPGADVDFFTFGAGPGLVAATLRLPSVGVFHKGYMLTLYDANHKQVAQAVPPFDGTGTVDGLCGASDCTTSASQVVLMYSNPSGGQLFLEVSGGAPSENGPSISGVNSTVPYTLQVSYNANGALGGSIVSARFDADVFSFTVQTATFAVTQPYHFAYAQLRDHALSVVPNTLTHVPPLAGDFLVMLSSQNGGGRITGQLQLQTGFASRFPSLGSVHLEIFGAAQPTAPYGVAASTVSLGLSQTLNLTTNQTDVKAWNNVFNPSLGQKATIKWDIETPGHVTMRLYTLSGAFIATLVDGDFPAGKGAVDWTGTNKTGGVVANGVYLLHIEAPGLSKTQKIAVVK